MPKLKTTSQGVCNFCGEPFDKTVIVRHISDCREEHLTQTTTGKKQKHSGCLRREKGTRNIGSILKFPPPQHSPLLTSSCGIFGWNAVGI